MNTLADWLAHLESLHPKGQGGIELGLERVARVKAALQQSQDCPLIVVGGTNGKGSTCAYLEAIYRFAGYRVGCYSSPHLLEYSERVRVDGVPIDDASLCAAFARVEVARQAAGKVALTYFEFGTLAAWEVFAASRVEVLILEVGLGGRLDAVNVYDADCAVVTGIALDHTDWLGATREAIGFEKAGIFRPASAGHGAGCCAGGRFAFCADPEPPQSLLDHAAAIGADLQVIGRDFGYFGDKQQWTFWGRQRLRRGGLALPALRGRCQLGNAAAVLAVVESLKQRLPVPMQAVRRGLLEVRLAGRFEVLPGRPAVVLDVAHNPQAVAGLAENLGQMGHFERTIAVVGMLGDKDIAGALAQLAGKIDYWLLATLDQPRGASADALAAVVAGRQLGGSVACYASPGEAFASAAKRAGENDRIVVFGSFYTVAAVMRTMKRRA